MESRFKTSNIVALLIAVALIATGFALMFIHQRSESAKEQMPVTHLSTTNPHPAIENPLPDLLASRHTPA